MTVRKTLPRRLASVAAAKGKRTASEQVSAVIEGAQKAGAPNANTLHRKPGSRSSSITSEGHTRKIYGPVLEGKRHLTDEVIASIAEKISSK